MKPNESALRKLLLLGFSGIESDRLICFEPCRLSKAGMSITCLSCEDSGPEFPTGVAGNECVPF